MFTIFLSKSNTILSITNLITASAKFAPIMQGVWCVSFHNVIFKTDTSTSFQKRTKLRV